MPTALTQEALVHPLCTLQHQNVISPTWIRSYKGWDSNQTFNLNKKALVEGKYLEGV